MFWKLIKILKYVMTGYLLVATTVAASKSPILMGVEMFFMVIVMYRSYQATSAAI